MLANSFVDKIFTIDDPYARIRSAADFGKPLTDRAGKPLIIPKGTKIKVTEVRTRPTGSKSVDIFVHAQSVDGANAIGWTSSTNVKGKFYSETLESIKPPANASRYGGHAAWQDGAYLRQLTLIQVVGSGYEIEHIASHTCEAFLALCAAAQKDGRSIHINSGFRSYPEQSALYDGFKRKLLGFNPANPPGRSNHQNGLAFDLDVKPGEGNPNYEWLKTNATRFGFLRTVSREAWHWEYLPEKAAKARAKGKFSTF